MGSRDNEQTQHHQPLLSSLVVRASDSDGGGRGGGSDYEPGEVRRDPPPYSHSDRFYDDPPASGFRIRAGSGSPMRRRNGDHEYGSDFDHLDGPQRNRGLGNGRDTGRYGDISPPYGRGRSRSRPFGRNFDGPGFIPGRFRGEGMNRSHPNVRPREGDWFCPDPLCGNLNFARRESCNTCKKHRYGSGGPPPPSRAPPRYFSGHSVDRSPDRPLMGYRSPPSGWSRGGPRDFGGRGSRDFGGRGSRDFGGRGSRDFVGRGFKDLGRGHGSRDFGGRGHRDFVGRGFRDFEGRGTFHPRNHEGRGTFHPTRNHEGRFPDRHIQRDRADMDYPERNNFVRPMAPDWSQRERGREDMYNDRKGYERRPESPAHSPQANERGRWPRDVRERSRSPIRSAFSPKEYRREVFMERGRDDRRGGLLRDAGAEDGY